MLGKPVQDFSVSSTGGSTFRLSDARGTKLVLYFYPKDNTPGRTQQGPDFRGSYAAFQQPFKSKMKFPFELFGVINTKNMYRRKVRGIERSTFVIDEGQKVLREWRGVKVPSHVQEVLNFVKAL